MSSLYNKGYTVLCHDSTYKAKKLMLKVDWVSKNIAPFCKDSTLIFRIRYKYEIDCKHFRQPMEIVRAH